MPKTGNWLDCLQYWHWDTTTMLPCGQQAPRRVALCLFQVADSRQSLPAENPPPSSSSPPHSSSSSSLLHAKRNKLQSYVTLSSISLVLLPHSSEFSSHYLDSSCISSMSFISSYTSSVIPWHFPFCYQIFFRLFIFPMFSSLVSPCRISRLERSNKKRVRPM